MTDYPDYPYPKDLIESFEILDEIEYGAYGLIHKVMKKNNVYLGDHQLYALKLVDTHWITDSWTKYWKLELEKLSWIFPYKLHSVYHFGDISMSFMIIDYCENGDLLKEIENKSKIAQYFEEDEIWKYFIEICFGLEYFNSRGFIHQDLHPKNIYLDENKDIKLGDFGISHYLDSLIKKPKGVFSIFSSLLSKKKYENEEGDIWAAGCVLYHLLTLKNPFEGNLKKGENYMLIKGNYSDEIKSFVDWCLRTNRNERPTINQILTHEFIVNKTMSLGIKIPKFSVMRTIYNPIEEIKEIVYPQIDIPLLKSINKKSEIVQNDENYILTLQALEEKTAEIINKPIDSELEQDFRRISSIYKINAGSYDPAIIKAYENYANTYNQRTTMYKFVVYEGDESRLAAYSTENEVKDFKEWNIQKLQDECTSIVMLPDGRLFCFSNRNNSGITFIIDENGRIENLPSGGVYSRSGLIYYNSNVYRFGGWGAVEHESARYDLVKKQWFKIPSEPEACMICSVVLFNNNFLLTPYGPKNIFIYSSDIESYSVIPYDFDENSHRILIYAEKRLYLMEKKEGSESISESEVGDEYNWKRIAASKLNIPIFYQSCCLYNKGGIYIGEGTSASFLPTTSFIWMKDAGLNLSVIKIGFKKLK